MKIVDVGAKFDLLVLEDVYTEEQTKDIWKELGSLIKNEALQPPEISGSAKNEDGTNKKKNKSLFLDLIYQQEYRFMSPILRYTEQVLLGDNVKNLMENINPALGIFKMANHHGTLVSYYENDDGYDFHKDQSAFSTLSYFFKEPQQFLGGEIVFSVNGNILQIPVKNNMSIIFPSCYNHMVKPIKIENSLSNQGFGRFCISQFVGIGAF